MHSLKKGLLIFCIILWIVPPIDDKHSQACFFWFDEKPLLKIELINARIFCILLLDASEAFFKLYQIFFRAIFDLSNKIALLILLRKYALFVKKQFGDDKVWNCV